MRSRTGGVVITNLFVFAVAALFEIAGCFSRPTPDLCLIQFGGPRSRGGYDAHDRWPVDRSDRPRRQFTLDFRAGVARLVLDEGSAVARHMDPTA